MRYVLAVIGVAFLVNQSRCGDFYEGRSKFVSRNREKPSFEVIDRYEDEDSVKPSTYGPLKDFLEKYANKMNGYKDQEVDSTDSVDVGNREKPKSWDLLHVSQNQYSSPQDDKKGWVTLDVVPWSISKVSKWQSKYKPAGSSNWDEIYEENYQHQQYHPQTYHKPHKPDPRPVLSDPLTEENEKISYKPWNRPYQSNYQQKKKLPCTNGEIMTDGLPTNFPTAASPQVNRRHTSSSQQRLPISQANNQEDGDWVLLSTTKGYRYPKTNHRRSLRIIPSPFRTQKSVSLTVLPPDKDSDVNMTTSHGGLLEVESTFKTVDQSLKDFRRKERLKKQQQIVTTTENEFEPVDNVITTLRRPNNVDSSALIAAVGAGMIPATMAMLVPMAMNGKRKRSADGFIRVLGMNDEIDYNRNNKFYLST